MENNTNPKPETNEEVKVGIFTKAKNGIKSVGDKIPAPAKKVIKIVAIGGGTAITAYFLGKHVDLKTGNAGEEADPDEEDEETPF